MKVFSATDVRDTLHRDLVGTVAESNGVSTPSFFGYLARYSIPILIPVFFVVWVIFFSGFIVDVTSAGEMCVTFLGTCSP